jgi:hypothetical protein
MTQLNSLQSQQQTAMKTMLEHLNQLEHTVQTSRALLCILILVPPRQWGLGG